MEVTIARIGRWTVPIAAATLTILSPVKSLSEIAGKINGWHLSLALSLFVLAVSGADAFNRWLNRKLEIVDRLEKEMNKRDAAVPGYVKACVDEYLNKRQTETKA
jgi:hypothetical protein